MRRIPPKLREQIAQDPYMKVCARKSDDCSGRITWEHAWVWAGRQINEPWAIIPLCWEHHLGSKMDKRINQAISIARATPENFKKYPKVNWPQLQSYLKLFAPKPLL